MTNPIRKYEAANELSKSSDPLFADLGEILQKHERITQQARKTREQPKREHNSKQRNAIFAFDTTSSMNPCIEAVRNNLATITNNLLTKTGTNIMVAGVGEYTDAPYTTQIRDFTTNPQTLKRNLESIKNTGGGGACQVSLEILWQELNNSYITPGQKYVMIVTTDEIAHGQDRQEPHPRANYRQELNKLRPHLTGFCIVSCTENQRTIELQKQLLNPTSDFERHIPLKNMMDLEYLLPDLFVAITDEAFEPGSGIAYVERQISLPGTSQKRIQALRKVKGYLE